MSLFKRLFTFTKEREVGLGSASVAKDRLQLILINERSGSSSTTLSCLEQLQQELIEVISRHIAIKPDDIFVALEKQDELEVLEVKIELPSDV